MIFLSLGVGDVSERAFERSFRPFISFSLFLFTCATLISFPSFPLFLCLKNTKTRLSTKKITSLSSSFSERWPRFAPRWRPRGAWELQILSQMLQY